MSVKPERRSGASPAEVANKKPVKGVLKIGTVEMWPGIVLPALTVLGDRTSTGLTNFDAIEI